MTAARRTAGENSLNYKTDIAARPAAVADGFARSAVLSYRRLPWAFRRSAQYFFIRSETAFRAAALMVLARF